MRAGTIRLDGVTKRFGAKAAVDDVSFDVDQAEFFSILGPSGSGKSTTLMMLAGFESPSFGDIRVGGQSVVGLPPQKRQLGMMFQSYAVFPHMSVYQNIAFPLEVRGHPTAEIRREVGRVLEIVRLPGYEARSPRNLSGGELQRVALARAIVFGPKVLLMDEPLSALDKELRNHMQLELKRIQRELGVTVVYVTHDQGEALSMSDKLAVMNHGRLEQVGTPQELYERPLSRFVAGFIGESNLIEATVTGTDGKRTAAVTRSGLVLRGGSPHAVKAGDTVTVAIRPEKLNVGTPAQGEHNAIRGRIRVSNYGGEYVRYSLATADGDLIVKLANRSDVSALDIGQELAVVWNAQDTTFFLDRPR